MLVFNALLKKSETYHIHINSTDLEEKEIDLVRFQLITYGVIIFLSTEY